MENFFLNSLWKDHKVNSGKKTGTYIVDEKIPFRVCDATKQIRLKANDETIMARYNTEIGHGKMIPLWLLGFLY